MMRRTLLFSLLALIGLSLYAQLDAYRRNILTTVLVYHPEDEFGTDIANALDSLPAPDNYETLALGALPEPNNHEPAASMALRRIDNREVMGVQATDSGFYKAANGHALSEKEVLANALYTERLLNLMGLAEQMIAAYRQQTPLGNADEETLNHMFVLVHDITYITSEQRLQVSTRTPKKLLGGLLDTFTGTTTKTTSSGSTPSDPFDGFKIKTHSYLYRLSTDLSAEHTYRLQYVAHHYDFDERTVLVGQYSRAERIRTLCARSIDRNIMELGQTNEDFKAQIPVTEVLTDGKGHALGYAAKIGMRDGISETSKLMVVQRVTDPKTRAVTYRYVAMLKPVKGAIWDNRYNALAEQSEGAALTYTTFKKIGGGNILPGMLLVDGRYSKTRE